MLYLLTLIFLLGLGVVRGCNPTKVFVPTNGDANLQFSVPAPQTEHAFILEGQFEQDEQRHVVLRIRYTYGAIETETISGYTFSGNVPTGDISITVNSVDVSKAGLYIIRNFTKGVDLTCTRLYTLGKPLKATIDKSADPELSGYINFTCSSSSTTKPTDHQLRFNYNWIFNGIVNPTEDRFKYGEAKKTMNVSDIVKTDRTKPIQCEAVEDVHLGLRSDRSEPLYINVLYGPQNLRFIPRETKYTFQAGQVMDSVNCTAECNPNCDYTWLHQQTDSTFRGQILSLQIINISDAGTYTCTAQRPSSSDSKVLQIDVIYGPLSVDLVPAQENYREDENKKMPNITCSALCWPCKYEWIGQEALSHGPILSLGALERNEHGQYTCKATNLNSSVEFVRHITVEVRYGPDKISLNPSQVNITINEGDPPITDRSCNGSCFPPCSYKWTKPAKSSASSTNGRLMFRNTINRKDSGVYTCTATNPEKKGFNKTVEFSIHVRYGPDNVDVQPSNSVYTKNVGQVLDNITCISDCYPPCAYAWFKETDDLISNNSTLKLDSLTKEETGTYVCKASNTEIPRFASTKVTVNIRFGPDAIKLDPNRSSHTVVEGRYLQDIKCFAECYPGCSEKWWNVSSPYEMLNEADGILSLGKASRYYTGDYRCTATNEAKEYNHSLEKSVTVTVHYFPDVLVYLERGGNSPYDDKTTIFICNATGLPAKYTFSSWVHIAPDNITPVGIYNGTTSGNQNRLMLPTLSYMDSGTYICNVTNTVEDLSTGSLYATNGIEFTKKGEPQILPKISRTSAALGSSSKLSTSFYSNDDTEPNVLWFKLENGTRRDLQNDTKRYRLNTSETVVTVFFYSKEIELLGYESELTIVDISPDDFGSYQVQVNNSVGYNSSTFSILPEGPPETPTFFGVSLKESTSSSVTLNWRSGFYGGASQTFHIDYRKKGSEEWHLATEVFGGEKENILFNTTVNGLAAGTSYEFQIYASNKFNRSDVSVTEGNTTAVQQVEDQAASSNIGLIAGGAAGGAVLAAIIGALVILVRRRRQDYSKSSSKRLLKDKERPVGTNGAGDTPEINLNPMYESAGPLSSTLNNCDVYSQVDKNRKTAKPVGDIYSKVDKPKQRQTTGGSAMKNDVYAQVQKTPHKEKDAGKPKYKKQKPDKKTKKGKQTEGDLYDNVDTINSTVSKDDLVYENPSCSIEDEHPKQMRNQDELVYADLDLPKETIGKDRKVVIHGLDDRTDYADIKYGEVGEEAPESDGENTSKE